MMTGIIQSLIEIFAQAFRNLHLNPPEAVLEDLAITVHKAMSVEGRHYHTSAHVLSLADAQNPIQSLAALFHDIVYYQIDRGFSSEVMQIIWPHIGFNAVAEAELSLAGPAHPDDLCYRMAMDVFDFAPGQKLYSTAGFNEFLSALVMATMLRSLVPQTILLQVMAYIEATIPFRGQDENGSAPFERLEGRLRQACHDYQIPLGEPEIIATVRGAVLFANRDVDNFAEADPALFLVNTWKLLPETNFSLRSGVPYSIRDYRQALQKTDRFFSQVVPEQVFHRYRGAPPEEVYWDKVRATRHNLHISRQYLGIKLLSVGILEALAEISGGDAPLSLFMGDLPRPGESTHNLRDHLPPPVLHPEADPGSLIYDLLATGRGSPPEFTDLRNSPLSTFIYCTIGPTRAREYLEHARDMFEGRLDPEQFLQRLDPALLSAIARACSCMLPTRSEMFKRYVQ